MSITLEDLKRIESAVKNANRGAILSDGEKHDLQKFLETLDQVSDKMTIRALKALEQGEIVPQKQIDALLKVIANKGQGASSNSVNAPESEKKNPQKPESSEKEENQQRPHNPLAKFKESDSKEKPENNPNTRTYKTSTTYVDPNNPARQTTFKATVKQEISNGGLGKIEEASISAESSSRRSFSGRVSDNPFGGFNLPGFANLNGFNFSGTQTSQTTYSKTKTVEQKVREPRENEKKPHHGSSR